MYNRVRTPKFYIDAILLARQLGLVTRTVSDNGKYFLNPTKTTELTMPSTTGLKHIHLDFNHRWFCNSLTHSFVLGHQLNADNIGVSVKLEEIDDDGVTGINQQSILSSTVPSNNGWNKFNLTQDTNGNYLRLVTTFTGSTSQSFTLGDISVGWSYEMPHSPDLELTLNFDNESLKTQTTKGGHTLTNTGWNQPPKWDVYPQWKRSPSNVAYPTRRSWSLKFSYLGDDNVTSPLMPQYYNELDSDNDNRGIFERISADSFSIKNDFLSKVYAGTNGFQLPFIFQPDKDVEEYAICRVNSPMSFNQVANNVYDVGFDIVEVW